LIITITMNPAIDFTYLLTTLEKGKLNRTKSPARNIGGKGINAGRTAALSGAEVLLAGFLGGKLGALAREYLTEENLFRLEMLEISDETRSSITIMSDNGLHTEIVEEGPKVKDEEVFALLDKVGEIIASENVSAICICGSVNSDNEQMFALMMNYIRENISKELPVLVDISGIQLTNLLNTKGHKPTFIKPNEHELSYFYGSEVVTKDDAYKALKMEQFADIPFVVASLGENGAVCKMNGEFYTVSIPKIPIQSVTGSGDATVGGFAYALEKGFGLMDTIKYAMACGMCNAQHEMSGMIDKQVALGFMDEIIVEKLS